MLFILRKLKNKSDYDCFLNHIFYLYPTNNEYNGQIYHSYEDYKQHFHQLMAVMEVNSLFFQDLQKLNTMQLKCNKKNLADEKLKYNIKKTRDGFHNLDSTFYEIDEISELGRKFRTKIIHFLFKVKEKIINNNDLSKNELDVIDQFKDKLDSLYIKIKNDDKHIHDFNLFKEYSLLCDEFTLLNILLEKNKI